MIVIIDDPMSDKPMTQEDIDNLRKWLTIIFKKLNKDLNNGKETKDSSNGSSPTDMPKDS